MDELDRLLEPMHYLDAEDLRKARAILARLRAKADAAEGLDSVVLGLMLLESEDGGRTFPSKQLIERARIAHHAYRKAEGGA